VVGASFSEETISAEALGQGAAFSELAARAQVPHATRTVPASEADRNRDPLTREATRYHLASYFDATFDFGPPSVLDAVRRAGGNAG